MRSVAGPFRGNGAAWSVMRRVWLLTHGGDGNLFRRWARSCCRCQRAEVGVCLGRVDGAGELCQVRFEHCVKEDGASCWERGQPAAGQEEGDVLQGFVKQIQLTAPEAAQLSSALSHNSKKQVKMISNEQNRSVRNIMLINMTHYLFQHSVFTQMVVYLPDIILFELFLFHGLLTKDLAMIIYTKDQFILPAEKCSSLHNLHMLLSKDLFSYSNISWRISLLLVIFPRH